jgi:hypothetical protein
VVTHICRNIQKWEMPNVPVAISTGLLPAGTVKWEEKEEPECHVTPA